MSLLKRVWNAYERWLWRLLEEAFPVYSMRITCPLCDGLGVIRDPDSPMASPSSDEEAF